MDAAWPLRDQPAEIIDVPGAVAIQECAERIEWNMMTGDPLTYASHLRTLPLAGVSPKHILFQIALGDRSELNPVESNEIRAAGMREMTSLYRHDLAYAASSDLALDPHSYGFPSATASAGQKAIARAAQRQITDFLSGEGLSVPDVNDMVRAAFGQNLFEVPATLPTGFNFVTKK